ncbi:MAG: hypothetical protein J5563_05200 [Clostridia bacterium]|nr:hypothetical protein [Clostridia bacterium]
MKKLLSVLLSALLIAAIAVSASAIDFTGAPDAAKTEDENGITYFGLANKDADVSYNCDGAVAYLPAPVGRQNFSVTFKLYWDESNLDEGQKAEDGTSYLDHFVSIFTCTDPANLVFSKAGGNDPSLMLQHRLVNRHIQQIPWQQNGSDVDIADYGGYTVSTNTMLNLGGVAQIYLEVETDDDGTTTISAYALDGTTERAKCHTVRAAGTYSADKDQYFCFAVGGSPVFAVYDFAVVSSDIEGVAGTSPIDFKFSQSPDYDSIVPVGIFVEKEVETTEETEEETVPVTDTKPETSKPADSAKPVDSSDKAPENEGKTNTGLIIGIVAAAVVVAAVVAGIVISKKKK